MDLTIFALNQEAQMAVEMFLKIDGIPGESKDGHRSRRDRYFLLHLG